MKTKNALLSFIILLLGALVVLSLNIKVYLESENELVGKLKSYNCVKWKSNYEIYNYIVILQDEQKFFNRVKGVPCNRIKNAPVLGTSVTITVKGKTLLSMHQNERKILNYEIMKGASNQNNSILWFVFVILALGAVWSFYRFSKERQR